MRPVPLIRAAGGLLWRPGEDGRPLVCLVHRPRHDDWSLPKGKLLPGEHPLAAAVREVTEETGVRPVPQLPLPSSRYRPSDDQHRDKLVDFWAMVPTADGHEAVATDDSEVDQLAWLPVAEAARRLSYAQDRNLLHHWRALPVVNAVMLLVRHAEAGNRIADPAADSQRPLSASGRQDALALCRLLALFAPRRLISATPARCRQTLRPLAEARCLPIESDPAFDEHAGDPAAAAGKLRQLATDGAATVICSQGAIVPAVLQILTAEDRPQLAADSDAGRSASWATTKGDGWLLACSGPRLIAVAPLRLRA